MEPMRFGAPPPNPPAMWPFVLGTAAFISVLSYFSLKGQREIHARVERDRAARRARGESW
jgi:hypothetical protein